MVGVIMASRLSSSASASAFLEKRPCAGHIYTLFQVSAGGCCPQCWLKAGCGDRRAMRAAGRLPAARHHPVVRGDLDGRYSASLEAVGCSCKYLRRPSKRPWLKTCAHSRSKVPGTEAALLAVLFSGIDVGFQAPTTCSSPFRLKEVMELM